MNPRGEKPVKTDRDIPVSSSSIVPIHLLLVEDNPGDARLVYEMLRNQLHIKLEVADCLAACMMRLDQGGIDLVLLDLGLGDSQGLDTFTSVAHTHPALPVVALTGLDDDVLALHTVQAGGQDYLTKNTVTPEILRRTIRHAFERKRVELQIKAALVALQKSEENFRRSLEDSPLGVRVATATGETIYANKVLLDIYGYANVEELNKIPVKERYTPQSYAEFHLRKKAREEDNFETNEYEVNIVRKNGEIRHLQVHRKGILWNGTKQFQVIYQDISERKRMEAALRESEEKFRAMVETIPLAIYLSVGIEQISEYLNPEFIKLFGYTQDDIPTIEQWWPLAYPDETYRKEISEEWTRRVKRALETQSPIEPMEVVVTCKDGSKKNISWGYVTMGDKNYACGLDLTERKQAEEKIRNSLAEKEILLKEVHHRVKNNLMTIIGLIKMQGTKADNEMFDPLLQELEGRIRSMALVHERLHKSEDLAHIDLQSYIENMSAYMRTQFGTERDIHFSVQAADVAVSLDIAIPCGLILNELISNAFKHAFPGDKPRAGEDSCKIAVTVKHEGGILALSVADNGMGLPALTNWENPGTTGLRLIKMLSQQINGSIELDRSHGTTFRLRFAYTPLDT